jgi:hypothetical protein
METQSFVPLPESPLMDISPPQYSTRSRIPIRPNESVLDTCAGVMPIPLSLTVKFIILFLFRRLTFASVAEAWRRIFVKAS